MVFSQSFIWQTSYPYLFIFLGLAKKFKGGSLGSVAKTVINDILGQFVVTTSCDWSQLDSKSGPSWFNWDPFYSPWTLFDWIRAQFGSSKTQSNCNRAQFGLFYWIRSQFNWILFIKLGPILLNHDFLWLKLNPSCFHHFSDLIRSIIRVHGTFFPFLDQSQR